ncbi:MAG: hypothetical protein JXR07_07525 [Reichenbachiella sp.]
MKLVLIFTCVFFFSCAEIQKKEIIGLWELYDVHVDVLPQNTSPTFIQFKVDNSFAVAKRKEDFSGLYDLRSNKLTFYSEDNLWFNTAWKVSYLGEYLILQDLNFVHRHTKLRFKKIDKMPDFQEFEDYLIGKWQMYKMRLNGSPAPLFDTWFILDDHGRYTISDESGLLESGKVVINTRHKKVIFESDSTIWRAWTFGKELRLSNDEFDLEYSLRKSITKNEN